MTAGAHVLEVTRQGYQDARRELSVEAGEELRVRVVLPSLARDGRLWVTSAGEPQAVSLDGQPIGTRPVFGRAVSAGRHRLSATSASGAVAAQTLEIEPGQEVRIVLSADWR